MTCQRESVQNMLDKMQMKKLFFQLMKTEELFLVVVSLCKNIMFDVNSIVIYHSIKNTKNSPNLTAWVHCISGNTERNINTAQDIILNIIKQNDTRKITCKFNIILFLIDSLFISLLE